MRRRQRHAGDARADVQLHIHASPRCVARHFVHPERAPAGHWCSGRSRLKFRRWNTVISARADKNAALSRTAATTLEFPRLRAPAADETAPTSAGAACRFRSLRPGSDQVTALDAHGELGLLRTLLRGATGTRACAAAGVEGCRRAPPVSRAARDGRFPRRSRRAPPRARREPRSLDSAAPTRAPSASRTLATGSPPSRTTPASRSVRVARLELDAPRVATAPIALLAPHAPAASRDATRALPRFARRPTHSRREPLRVAARCPRHARGGRSCVGRVSRRQPP